jgi:ABC-type branched-subunit amino acid transport system substrate-binding protein
MTKRAWTILLAAAATGGTLGCHKDMNPGGTITLGSIISTTGSLGSTGTEQLEAIQLAIDEINGAGGVLGSQLALAQRDDATQEDQAKGAATALAALKVPAVIGAIGSQLTLDSAAITSAAQIVQVSGSSTSPAITTHHGTDTPSLFRTCPSDALQGKLLAARAHARPFSKVAVVHLPGAYGQGLADAFQQSFTAVGGTVTDDIQYTEGQRSYVDLYTMLYMKNPEAILLVAYGDDGAQLIKDYNANFSSKNSFFYFTDAIEDSAFVTLAGGAASFAFPHEGTGPGAPADSSGNATPAYAAYKAAFKGKYNVESNPGSYSQNVYDAVYLLAGAIEAGGKSDGPTIKGALVSVSRGKQAGAKTFGPGKWADLSAAITAGTDVNYEGASGNVDMDANGDVVAPYDLWKVAADGSIQILMHSVSPPS